MGKPKIVTLTLNPAVDRSGNVRRLEVAHKLRCLDERMDPGGGGINVARVLTRLGADVLAVFPAGGPTGTLLRQMVQAEKVRFESPDIAGATRENFNVQDMSNGAQYRFVFPGPGIPQADLDRCCDLALQQVTAGTYLVCSGSLPPGAASGLFAHLARRVTKAGGKFVLDSSGPAMTGALGAGIEIIKLNETELADLAGTPVCDRDGCVAAARLVVAAGPKMAAITRGEKGALLVTDRGCWEAVAPPVRALSTVGAGDSFLAVLIWCLASNQAAPEALRAAVAAGSAALLTEGTGLALPPDIIRLSPIVTVRAVSGQLQMILGA